MHNDQELAAEAPAPTRAEKPPHLSIKDLGFKRNDRWLFRNLNWEVPRGSVVAVIIWLIASALFAFYVANFGSYDKTYGSLGGGIVFLVWLWITNVAVLFGNQLNAERERSEQFEEGRSGAETELQLDERNEPKDAKRPTTA